MTWKTAWVWGFGVLQGDAPGRLHYCQPADEGSAQNIDRWLIDGIAQFACWPLLALRISRTDWGDASLLVATPLADEDSNLVGVDVLGFAPQGLAVLHGKGQIRADFSLRGDQEGRVVAKGDFDVVVKIFMGDEVTRVQLFLEPFDEDGRKKSSPLLAIHKDGKVSQAQFSLQGVPEELMDRFQSVFAFSYRAVPGFEVQTDSENLFVAVLPFPADEILGIKDQEGS